MRRFLLPIALISLLLLSPALADDQSSRRRADLDEQRRYYEEMLRDAKTETAAKYFVLRLGEIAEKRKGVDDPPASPTDKSLAFADAWLRKRIARKVQEQGIGLSDVTAWTRRELPGEFWAAFAARLGARRPALLEFARRSWANRTKGTWLPASFGSGTFIVMPPVGPKAPRADHYERLPDDVKAKLKIPRAPTRDEWWARASTRERTEWTLAFFVQRSDLFEVADAAMYKDCAACTGVGHQGKKLSSGHSFSYLCHRCAGTQRDKTIRFR